MIIMSNRETFYLAAAPSSRRTRAVLTKNGEVVDRTLIPVKGVAARDEIADFLYGNLVKANYFSNVIFTCFAEDPWPEGLETLLEDRPGLFHLDILEGNAARLILTMDTWIREDPFFRRLELIAHLCTLQRQQGSLEHPGLVLLEWAINRAKDQVISLEEKLKDRCSNIMRQEIRNHDDLLF
jgi:hypothetical protein